MQIRRRLTLGMGILFAMIVMLSVQSIKYVLDLSKASGNILSDNYNSLLYANNMMTSLDSLSLDTVFMSQLLHNMALQERNITEVDEFQLTSALGTKIKQLSDTITPLNIQLVRNDLYRIIDVNMSSIRENSSQLEREASQSTFWISISAILCGIVALLLLLRFPRAIAKPIIDLKEGIMEIANHNYDRRLNFNNNKEFKPVADSFNNMAEKLSEYKQSTLEDLMITNKRIEAIVNSLHEPIIGLDPQKKILFMNDEAYKILNLKPTDVIGRNATEVALSNDLLRRLIRELYSADQNKEPLKIYANDKESYFQMDNIPLYFNAIGDNEKSFIGNVIILNNITQYKELDSAKTNFISTVSHEMKTPISSILMSLQLLEDSRLGTLNDEQRSMAESIKESSDRLLSITGELLNMTQLETGKLKLIPKITKPIELIDYAVAATRVLAERFGCFVEVEYPEKIAKLFVDSEKVAWVVTNLLSNAIHHSSEGARVVVGALQCDNSVSIYVQDFGRGIDPRYHNSIFDRYFRVPGTKVQGSGLGLAISKEFVEAHGGTIGIESTVKQGSRFTITFPA